MGVYTAATLLGLALMLLAWMLLFGELLMGPTFYSIWFALIVFWEMMGSYLETLFRMPTEESLKKEGI